MNNERVSSHEKWIYIESTKERYSVSSEGRIRNNETGMILTPIKMPKGYTKVNLHYGGERKGYQVHRLVAMAFIPNPENKPQVNHKNGVKDDNRVTNLEWVTGEENLRHAYETGLQRHKDDRNSGYLYSVWRRYHKTEWCEEWQDYLKFHKWCYENGYKDGRFVCRYDWDLSYNPENCYIGNSTQRKSEKIEIHGEKLTRDEIAEKYNVLKSSFDYRMKIGLSAEEAVMYIQHKPKGESLRVRLNNSMYTHVCEAATKKNMTASAYVRYLIDKDISDGRKRKNIFGA